MFIRETFIDADKDAIFGKTDWLDRTGDTAGRIFRDSQREYGRCVSRVYRDQPDGSAKPVGWVFQSRQPYVDVQNRTYLREVWVEVAPEIPRCKTCGQIVES